MAERLDRRGRVERNGAGTSRSVRIVVVDDGCLAPECRTRLQREPPLLVVGETSRIAEVAALVPRTLPQVVVLASVSVSPATIAAIREVRQTAPGPDVMVVRARMAETDLRRCLEAGARAYVLRDDPDLARALRAVAAGGAYFSPEVAAVLRQGYLERGGLAIDGLMAQLTDADRSVLRALVDGLSRSEIADRLGVPPAAVDACRDRIVQTLGVGDPRAVTRPT